MNQNDESRSTEEARDGATSRETMSYSDYLRLDDLLAVQQPLSCAHDEFLFIIQHQTSELWMRLVIHELAAAREAVAQDNLQPAFKMLTRVARIFEQLNGAWDVLRTMTPSEYSAFRNALGQSSGFQSHQYREIEFALGNRDRARLSAHHSRPEIVSRLEQELARRSLYDEALHLLQRQGFDIPVEVLARDVSLCHEANDAVVSAWQTVYQAPTQWWPLYELAEKLVDLEDYFRRWRFNHMTTVERIIGRKRGTGGTGGVAYLRRMLDVELFPELWHVRTGL